MDLKKYFDHANAAEETVQKIAAELNDLFEKGQTEEALALRPRLDAAKKTAKEAHQLYLSMQAATVSDADPAKHFFPIDGDPEKPEIKNLRASDEYRKQYFDALKAGASPKSIIEGRHSAERYGRLMDALTETGGTPAGSEGGFLNPVDFDNMIVERKKQFYDLANDVNVEDVTAYSGWRVIETAAAAVPFAQLTENTDMPEAENPTYQRIDYAVKDYGGYLPVSNSLLSDTPALIMNYLSKWFARKVVLTDNSLILPKINALTPENVTFANQAKLADTIKKTLNKSLDPDVSALSSIYVNQTGFDILDQLKDSQDRPLLQPDPVNVTLRRLFGRSVILLSDRLWGNLAGTPAKARIGVGYGADFVTMFRRAALEMAATTIGGDSWRKNNTEIRGIMRADCQTFDSDAFKLITVDLA
ncbi:MAG: phage major capsid protein [Anaerolineaceae bacterium]